MDFKKYGIAGALVAIAIAVLILVFPKKQDQTKTRDEILEKAREAKKIKSLVNDQGVENIQENE